MPPAHVLWVSTGNGMNEIMFSAQMNTNSVATYGNQRVKALRGSVARPMFVSVKV